MSEWRKIRIGDLGRNVTGKTPPTEEAKYFNGPFMFVSPKDLDRDTWRVSGTETTVTREALEKFKGQVIPANAVLYTSLSFAFGKMGIASEECLTNQQINSIVVSEEHDFKFVYYLLKSNRDLIFSYNSGIDTPIVPKSVFEKIEVSCPPLPVQRKIAAVLSAYDDLIENNARRIALLEKMAEEVYREWFVRLRFPGHESVPMHQGVPEGWRIAPISELCDSIDYGFTASAEANEVGPKFLRITDIVPNMIDWKSVPHCRIDDARVENFRLKTGDIVIARSGSVGYAKRLHKHIPDAVFASYLVRLRLKADVDDIMVGVYIESEAYREYVRAHCGGVAQPNANARVLSSAKILVPTQGIQSAYRRFAEPIFDQIEVCQIENQRLRENRDLLLSRLLSGKLDVDDLDIRFPPGMGAAE